MMERQDRIAVVGVLWFVGWIITGDEVGRLLECPGTGAVLGFLFALVSVFSWPWILPDFIENWMHAPSPDAKPLPFAEPRFGRWWSTAPVQARPEDTPQTGGFHRVLIVAGMWFLFWMVITAAISGWFGQANGTTAEGLYFGFFNGAWWALLTSFAWPWILPARVDGWMYRT